MNMTRKEACDILGLTENASEQDIKKAYRRLSKQVHQDTGGTDALFRIVRSAYERLNTPDMQVKSNETKQTTASAAKSETKTVTWRDLVLSSDFRLPYQTLFQIAKTGATAETIFQNYRVPVSLQQLEIYPVKSIMPLTCTISSWPTIIHRWLGLRPRQKDSVVVDIKNKAFFLNDFRASCEFYATLQAKHLKKGYHELSVQAPGVRRKTKVWLSKWNKSAKRHIHVHIPGMSHIIMGIDVAFKLKA